MAETAADEAAEVDHPKVEIEDALKYLENLENFQLQQDTPDKRVLESLSRMKRDIEARRLRTMGKQKQKRITMYFGH